MELLIILLLVMLNGVLAMSEIAVVSARRSRLARLAEEGNRRAEVALDLADNPGNFLSTVQVGITLIGIVAGAYGGTTLARSLSTTLDDWGVPYPGAVSYGGVIALTTYLSLVIGELAPKRLALLRPEQIALWVALPMHWLATLARPVVKVLTFSTDGVLRLLNVRDSHDPDVTEADIMSLIEVGTRVGVVDQDEAEMVDGVFLLDDVRADAIMTPRTDVQWLNIDAPAPEMLTLIANANHSRYPVCRESLDDVLGVVHVRHLVHQHLNGQVLNPKPVLEKPIFVPDSQSLDEVLERLKRAGQSLALVIGEFGGVQGIVTITDIVEEIVGELETPEAVQQADGSWLMVGLLALHELKELLNIGELPEDGTYQTLGGLALQQLDRIPAVGDIFTWGGWRFTVQTMAGRRVGRVHVARVNEDSQS